MFWGLIQKKNPTEEEVEELKKSLNVFEVPWWTMAMTSVGHILGEKLGFVKSAQTLRPVLGNGDPIPMFPYSVIEYLMNMDLSGYDVLEFGAGNSTMFWAPRVKSVTSLENDPEWHTTLQAMNLPGAELHLVEKGKMADYATGLGKKFDIISVDCGENRYHPAKASLGMLKEGGFIILDNSEWYPNTSTLLRESGLLQVDFYDFRPCHHYRTATSLFFDRKFSPKPKGQRMPATPIGGREQNPLGWDDPEG
ncbi:MAG: hypothetical protein IH995_07470 [Proteobacteria bacterium]|nr:hypothetical protein [Pseudomonadota bacterium]